MRFMNRTMVDLGDRHMSDRLGHISTYEKKNGNVYKVYFIEARYFGFKEIDLNGLVVSSGRSSDDYHYSLDVMFEDETRFLKWN